MHLIMKPVPTIYMAKIGIVSLGCARNLVDSEAILGILKEKGDSIVDIDKADVAIINTCAFIEDAKIESIDTILGLLELKKKGLLKKVVVAGCLPQRYKDKLPDEFGEVDGFMGVDSPAKVKGVIDNVLKGKRITELSKSPRLSSSYDSPRVRLTPLHYTYLKIQEGCGNKCSFCVIPQIKGPLRSRTKESIIREVERLPAGVSEINVIGQDISMYGLDIYRELKLAELLKKIVSSSRAKWIRLLYAHPARLTSELIELIKNEPRICKYLDLPLQHINSTILNKMKRSMTRKEIISTIDRLRKNIPGVTIRTSFIVGFPGEGENEFKELCDFVKDMRFERLGVFTYSKEEGTEAAGFPDQVPEDIKQERFDRLMQIQQEISKKQNENLLGKKVEVLIDEKVEGKKNCFLGRTRSDAPEVDGQVWVTSSAPGTIAGKIVTVKVTDTLEYDLVGEVL